MPSLPALLARSRLVLVGTVTSVESYEAGLLAVARVRPDEVLKGSHEGEVAVVERHDLPSAPDLFQSGDRVVLFLEPGRRSSSLLRALPEGRYFEPTDGRHGAISGSAPEVSEVADIVRRLVAASRAPEPDSVRRRAQERALVFARIGARHPALVADGAAALGELSELAATLEPAEQRTLAAALARTDLPAWVRVRLLESIGDAGLVALVPAIRALPDPDAQVLEASWEALRRLGEPPRSRELQGRLASADPTIREAAVRALALTREPGTVRQIERVALEDREQAVRTAAAEALGKADAREAVPALERIFPRADWPARQAAGRALLALGGRSAQEALGRLVFRGEREAEIYALTLLLVSGIAHDDPLLERIRTTHPDERVRHVASEGFPRHEH